MAKAIRRFGHAALTALLLACAPASHASIYKCNSNGHAVFQENPCSTAPEKNSAAEPTHTPASSARGFGVELLIVKNQLEKDDYLRTPVANRKDKGRLRTLKIGQTYLFPIIVEDYQPPQGSLVNFSAHATLVGADGRRHPMPGARYTAQNAAIQRVSFVVLNPILNVSFDTSDKPGRYLLQVSVTDDTGGGTRSIEEWFDVTP